MSDLQVGQLLFQAGRLEHAKVFLMQAVPTTEEERVEQLFLIGLIDLRLGHPAQAARSFEAILKLHPNLTRVKLELAHAYFLAGNPDRARFYFDSSMADQLPASVAAEVEKFLRQIDGRKPWSTIFSVAALPETKRTELDNVTIGGIPFELSEEAKASSGLGMFVSAGVSFSPQLSQNLHGIFGVTATAKIYENSSWDDTNLTSELGVVRRSSQGSNAGGMRFERRWLDRERHHQGAGPWVRIHRRINPFLQWYAAVNATKLKHESVQARDGWRITANPRLVLSPNTKTSIELGPVVESVSAKQEHHEYRVVGIEFEVLRALATGSSLAVSLNYETRRNVGADPLFGMRRKDQLWSLGARLRLPCEKCRKFSPYIGFSAENNRSNIPIYEYSNRGLQFGFSQSF